MSDFESYDAPDDDFLAVPAERGAEGVSPAVDGEWPTASDRLSSPWWHRRRVQGAAFVLAGALLGVVGVGIIHGHASDATPSGTSTGGSDDSGVRHRLPFGQQPPGVFPGGGGGAGGPVGGNGGFDHDDDGAPGY